MLSNPASMAPRSGCSYRFHLCFFWCLSFLSCRESGERFVLKFCNPWTCPGSFCACLLHLAGCCKHAADQEDREIFRGWPVLGLPGEGRWPFTDYLSSGQCCVQHQCSRYHISFLACKFCSELNMEETKDKIKRKTHLSDEGDLVRTLICLHWVYCLPPQCPGLNQHPPHYLRNQQ